MFEDSLFASGDNLEQKQSASSRRRLALLSVAVQASVLATSLVVPMVWPETLPLVSFAPKANALFTPPRPPVRVEPRPVKLIHVADNALRAPITTAPEMLERRGSGVIHSSPSNVEAMGAPSLYNGSMVSGGGPLVAGSAVGTLGSGSAPSVTSAAGKPAKPLSISQGVSAGLLLQPIRPMYPRIAVSAGVQGTVTVTAIINRQGRIVDAKVLNGPPMLQTAAIDAVRDARYRPYLLNGEPVEVSTTISVIFRLGA